MVIFKHLMQKCYTLRQTLLTLLIYPGVLCYFTAVPGAPAASDTRLCSHFHIGGVLNFALTAARFRRLSAADGGATAEAFVR